LGQLVSWMEQMDLLALSDFTLVARYGGFGRASRATGRPKATLSRRVTELEADRGIRCGITDPRDASEQHLVVRRGANDPLRLTSGIGEVAAAL
jgi:hypothetical protein